MPIPPENITHQQNPFEPPKSSCDQPPVADAGLSLAKKSIAVAIVSLLHFFVFILIYKAGLISYIFPLPLGAVFVACIFIFKRRPSLKNIFIVLSISTGIMLINFYLAMLFCLNAYGS